MNFLNKLFLIVFISILTMQSASYAVLDIDMSVDSEIRRKYNPEKAVEDLLSPLPDNLKNDKNVPPKDESDITTKNNEQVKSTATTTTTTKTSTTPVTNSSDNKNTTSQNTTKNNTGSLQEVKQSESLGQKITLKSGTKITVRSCEKLSDTMPVGRKVYFKLAKPIQTKLFTLPENTKFVATVVDSHTPQITGNGGLLVLLVERVNINGKNQEIKAKFTKSNYKKVFFNNIKGKRSYLKNVAEKTNFGNKYYKKMLNKSKQEHLALDLLLVLLFFPSRFTLAGISITIHLTYLINL